MSASFPSAKTRTQTPERVSETECHWVPFIAANWLWLPIDWTQPELWPETSVPNERQIIVCIWIINQSIVCQIVD